MPVVDPESWLASGIEKEVPPTQAATPPRFLGQHGPSQTGSAYPCRLGLWLREGETREPQYFMSMHKRLPLATAGTADTIPTTMGVVTPAAARFASESLQSRPFSLILRSSLSV